MPSIKAREIRELLANWIDPRIVKVLITMADDIRQIDKAVNELAILIDKTVDFTQALANAQHDVMTVTSKLPGAQKIMDDLRGKNTEDLGGDDSHGSNKRS